MTNNLWKALVLVREGEMCRFIRNDGHGRHCALGFLDATRNVLYGEDTEEGRKDVGVLASVLKDLFPERAAGDYPENDSWTVAEINNHQDTTKADLELAFEKAAIKRDELVV